MSNENGQDRDDPIVIDEQLIVADQGEHHRAVRSAAQAEIGGRYADQIGSVQWANFQLGQFFDLVRDTELKRGVNEALSQRDVIVGISNLNKVFRDVLQRLRSIIQTFIVPMEIDTATNMPVLNVTNAGALRGRLAGAHREIGLIPGKHHGEGHGDGVVIAPNTEIFGLFEKMVASEHFFDDPRNVLQVFKIVDTYLRAVIDGTGIGIASTVYHTSEQVGHLQGSADHFHDQAEAAEAFALEHDDETLQSWENFLLEIELVFAEAVVRLHELYGENVRWLTGELKVEDIRRIKIEAIRARKALEEQKNAKRLADEQAAERSGSLLRRLVTSEIKRDPTPYAVMNQRMMELSDTITRLDRLIEDKAKLPRKKE